MAFNPQFAQLGEILVHKGYINNQQLEEGLRKQKNFDTKIGETLIKLGYLKEDELLNALQLQLECDVIRESELLELDEDIVKLIPEPFAMENRVLAIRDTGNAMIVAMTDPENVVIQDSLQKMVGKNVIPTLIGESALTDALEKYYKSIRTSTQVDDAVGNFDFVAVDEEENEISIDSSQDVDAPVVKLVNLIITEAIKSNCTDIHIEPLTKKTRVRFRIDGALREVMTSPIGMHAGLVSIVKVMSKLNIAEEYFIKLFAVTLLI
jgi:type IV pilus assembly protein PilB